MGELLLSGPLGAFVLVVFAVVVTYSPAKPMRGARR